MRITDYRLTLVDCPLGRVIGDCQVRYDRLDIGALELITDTGQTGLGFFAGRPLPPASAVEAALARCATRWVGEDPFVLRNRLEPRRNTLDEGCGLFREAVDQAIWDLQGKALGLPLYRLLGGTDSRVPAYASGLDYHYSTEEACDFFAEAADRGFRAFKLKVGYPDLDYEIGRLLAIRERVGHDAVLMVDVNEGWSPDETILRAHAYRDAGLRIYWIEDPCLRDDLAGYRRVVEALPFTRINAGERMDMPTKRRLIEARALGVLNLHGMISESWHAAWLANHYRLPISIGNTTCELGVHLAAALPHVTWMEYSFLAWDALVTEPVRIENGYAYAPERPGHGLTLAR